MVSDSSNGFSAFLTNTFQRLTRILLDNTSRVHVDDKRGTCTNLGG